MGLSISLRVAKSSFVGVLNEVRARVLVHLDIPHSIISFLSHASIINRFIVGTVPYKFFHKVHEVLTEIERVGKTTALLY